MRVPETSPAGGRNGSAVQAAGGDAGGPLKQRPFAGLAGREIAVKKTEQQRRAELEALPLDSKREGALTLRGIAAGYGLALASKVRKDAAVDAIIAHEKEEGTIAVPQMPKPKASAKPKQDKGPAATAVEPVAAVVRENIAQKPPQAEGRARGATVEERLKATHAGTPSETQDAAERRPNTAIFRHWRIGPVFELVFEHADPTLAVMASVPDGAPAYLSEGKAALCQWVEKLGGARAVREKLEQILEASKAATELPWEAVEKLWHDFIVPVLNGASLGIEDAGVRESVARGIADMRRFKGAFGPAEKVRAEMNEHRGRQVSVLENRLDGVMAAFAALSGESPAEQRHSAARGEAVEERAEQPEWRAGQVCDGVVQTAGDAYSMVALGGTRQWGRLENRQDEKPLAQGEVVRVRITSVEPRRDGRRLQVYLERADEAPQGGGEPFAVGDDGEGTVEGLANRGAGLVISATRGGTVFAPSGTLGEGWRHAYPQGTRVLFHVEEVKTRADGRESVRVRIVDEESGAAAQAAEELKGSSAPKASRPEVGQVLTGAVYRTGREYLVMDLGDGHFARLPEQAARGDARAEELEEGWLACSFRRGDVLDVRVTSARVNPPDHPNRPNRLEVEVEMLHVVSRAQDGSSSVEQKLRSSSARTGGTIRFVVNGEAVDRLREFLVEQGDASEEDMAALRAFDARARAQFFRDLTPAERETQKVRELSPAEEKQIRELGSRLLEGRQNVPPEVVRAAAELAISASEARAQAAEAVADRILACLEQAVDADIGRSHEQVENLRGADAKVVRPLVGRLLRAVVPEGHPHKEQADVLVSAAERGLPLCQRHANGASRLLEDLLRYRGGEELTQGEELAHLRKLSGMEGGQRQVYAPLTAVSAEAADLLEEIILAEEQAEQAARAARSAKPKGGRKTPPKAKSPRHRKDEGDASSDSGGEGGKSKGKGKPKGGKK